MSAESFTVPESDLRRAWRWHWVAGAVGVGMTFLIRPSASLISLVGSAALVGGLVYFAYRATLRHVWVTLSTAGMSGRGETNRDLLFGWHEPVVVEERRKFGFKGVIVRRSEDGRLKRQVASVFIPEPVLRLEPFRAALSRFAPSSHPLSRKVGGAI
jgi:hypothetical protein